MDQGDAVPGRCSCGLHQREAAIDVVESGRSLALETVIQWLVFRVVQGSNRPHALLAELSEHMQQQKQLVLDFVCQQLRSGDGATWAEAQSALAGLDELRESILAAVQLGPATPQHGTAMMGAVDAAIYG